MMIAISIVSLVVIFTLLIFYGHVRFSAQVEKDKDALFNLSGNTEIVIKEEDLLQLPVLMQGYLRKVAVIGKCKDCHAIIKQKGRIRQKKEGNWITFTAKQFIAAQPIGFVWAARAFPMLVKDKCVLGKGEMHLSLIGLRAIALDKSHKTNESALNRCLAELVLYPVAFLNKMISWETLDETSVRATITVERTSTSGTFFFDEEGLITRFESKRYKGDILENFTGEMERYAIMKDIMIPTKMRAIWNLKHGDFEYFNCDIIDHRTE